MCFSIECSFIHRDKFSFYFQSSKYQYSSRSTPPLMAITGLVITCLGVLGIISNYRNPTNSSYYSQGDNYLGFGATLYGFGLLLTACMGPVGNRERRFVRRGTPVPFLFSGF